MLNNNAIEKLMNLSHVYGGKMVIDYPLKKHSSMKIGGNASVWYSPETIGEIKELKEISNKYGIEVVIMGAGSNVLVKDKGIDGIVLHLSGKEFRKIDIEDTKVTVGAGANLAEVISKCARHGLSGLEGLVGIPATVGGALFMNASYKSAISDYLSGVLLLNSDCNIGWVRRDDLSFGYRYSAFASGNVIIKAVFNLFKNDPAKIKDKIKKNLMEKKNSQPVNKRTLGCIFKNPLENSYSSGELLEKSGVKGLSVGDAQISKKHANFFINNGNARSDDVINLIQEAQKRVKEQFNVELEPEIRIW